MEHHGEGGQRWSISALADASGCTVRALYYYDEIGLLPASERTAAGHRRYTPADVRRLYQIRALQQLGCSLDEIGAVLRSASDDLSAVRDLLTTQLAVLDEQVAHIAVVRQQAAAMLAQIDGADPPAPDQFLTALEQMRPLPATADALTRHQRRRLRRRASELGAAEVDALRDEWVRLVHDLREHCRQGTPVDDPAVRTLVARWDRIGERLRTGDRRVDDQIAGQVMALWRDRRSEISAQVGDRLGWSDTDALATVVSYVERVRNAIADASDAPTGPA